MLDIDSKLWTWIAGDSIYSFWTNTASPNGIYGSQGITAPENKPGARYSHSVAYDETNKFVYVFGGVGFAQQDDGCNYEH